MALKAIRSVEVIAPTVVRVAWADGRVLAVDLEPVMRGHAMLEMLAAPEVFRDVAVVEGGGGIEWANGADLSSETLRRMGETQADAAA